MSVQIIENFNLNVFGLGAMFLEVSIRRLRYIGKFSFVY